MSCSRPGGRTALRYDLRSQHVLPLLTQPCCWGGIRRPLICGYIGQALNKHDLQECCFGATGTNLCLVEPVTKQAPATNPARSRTHAIKLESAMMHDDEPAVVARNLTASEIDAVEDNIYQINACRTGFDDAELLGFELAFEDQMVGAIAGFTWAGFCEIRQFWVDERFRGAGYGSALLKRAIAESRSRGCSHVYLATYSFQAPDFYKRFGFETLAVIENRPPGHRDFIMRLVL